MPANRRRGLLNPTMRILSRPTASPVGRLLKSLFIGHLLFETPAGTFRLFKTRTLDLDSRANPIGVAARV
jgi:hypothetical protein